MNQTMTICSAYGIITFYSSNTEKSRSQQILSIGISVSFTNSRISSQYNHNDSGSSSKLHVGIPSSTSISDAIRLRSKISIFCIILSGFNPVAFSTSCMCDFITLHFVSAVQIPSHHVVNHD